MVKIHSYFLLKKELILAWPAGTFFDAFELAVEREEMDSVCKQRPIIIIQKMLIIADQLSSIISII